MRTHLMRIALLVPAMLMPVLAMAFPAGGSDGLYTVNTHLQSRAITFENPTGAPGKGGMVASPLGVGRKGDPARMVQPGEEVELANIKGAGTIRHIWMTMHRTPEVMRSVVIRMYWDGQEHPSVEAPIGDFFGFAHGRTEPFQTAVHSVGKRLALNIWLPMPFRKNARITLTNEAEKRIPLFYQIDYTIGDKHPKDVGRLHVLFRRESPTTLGEDFEILPKRTGKGRFIGTVLGIQPDYKAWWGEGEVKIYLDGDKEFATIVGTGAEDYVGLSWGIQQNAFLYHGANLVTNEDTSDTGAVSMYRWHIPDPVYWRKDIRVTVQQIGHEGQGTTLADYKAQLFERQDDWSAATFWYESVPSAPLPPMPDRAARLAGIDLAPPAEPAPEDPGAEAE